MTFKIYYYPLSIILPKLLCYFIHLICFVFPKYINPNLTNDLIHPNQFSYNSLYQKT